jgi:molybdate transport system substrate-binding protein
VTGKGGLRALLAVMALVLGLAACSSSRASTNAAGKGYGTVTVLAAASLTGAFGQLAVQFEHARPGTHIRLSFGGSSSLAEQIANGAPADVFASADQANMAKVAQAGLLDGPSRVFARNLLQIVVAKGNPQHITGLADLSRHGLTVVLAGPAVPAGHYARQAFAKAGAKVPAASEATDVSQIITQVELGQADAGVAYVTDVRAAAGKVSGVAIPAADNVEASYPVGVLKGGPSSRGGHAFAAFVTSQAGRATLARYGFLSP